MRNGSQGFSRTNGGAPRVVSSRSSVRDWPRYLSEAEAMTLKVWFAGGAGRKNASPGDSPQRDGWGRSPGAVADQNRRCKPKRRSVGERSSGGAPSPDQRSVENDRCNSLLKKLAWTNSCDQRDHRGGHSGASGVAGQSVKRCGRRVAVIVRMEPAGYVPPGITLPPLRP